MLRFEIVGTADALRASDEALRVEALAKDLALRRWFRDPFTGQAHRYFFIDFLRNELPDVGFDLYREALEYVRSVER